MNPKQNKLINHDYKLWIYMGAYKMSNTLIPRLCDKNNCDYTIYKNLQTCESKLVTSINTINIFTKEDNLIFLNDSDFNNYQDYLEAFQKVREEFLNSLLKTPAQQVLGTMFKIRRKIK